MADMNAQLKQLRHSSLVAFLTPMWNKFRTELSARWLPGMVWQIQRSGVVGLVGLALCVGAGVFYYSSYAPVVDEVATLRDSLRSTSAKRAVEPPMATAAREAVGHLPDRNGITKELGVVFSSARRAGLSIENAKYDASVSKSGDITRYKVTFPVIGQYDQIRGFVDDILAREPTMSIGELAIQRKGVADPVVEARVRLTFYTRNRQ
jgi:hypothetical protein